MAISKSGAVLALCVLTASVARAGDASQLPYEDPDRPATALKPGANSFAESQARQRLEAQGYSQVSNLVNDSQGIWRGTALKGDRKVDVSVDFQGHVASQ